MFDPAEEAFPQGVENAIQKVGYTHDKLIDLIIANPRVKQGDLAAKFGYTEGWLSRVLSSDAFRVKLALRRQELIDPIISATLEERFKHLAIRGTEILQEKLDQPAALVSFGDAAKAVELGARGLAVGGFGAQTKVDIHNNVNLATIVQEAHERRKSMRQVYEAPPTPTVTIDTEFNDAGR